MQPPPSKSITTCIPQDPAISNSVATLTASHMALTRRQYLRLASQSSIGLIGLTGGFADIAGAAHATGSNSNQGTNSDKKTNLRHQNQHHSSALSVQKPQFPRDHGSHPGTHIEWWYLTGYVTAAERLWGFQVTFFRNRVPAAQPLQSAFAAKQLLFAHAALTDVQAQRLYHDQQIARTGTAWAQASENDTALRLSQWQLHRHNAANKTSHHQNTTSPPTITPPSAATYSTQIQSTDFSLQLECTSTQPLLLQGQQGLSRKGPDATHASYYYSQPQLSVEGHITLQGKRMPIAPHSPRTPARAWLDHEWSDALLAPDAVGWDWIGINLFDGSALTAFRLRRSDGSSLWAGGSFRAAGQAARIFEAHEVTFTPQRWWKSPRSNTHYPVLWQVNTPSGTWSVHAQVDDQELDSSTSTGAIYWEGLSTLRHAQKGAVEGMGYLEMTGYASPLKL